MLLSTQIQFQGAKNTLTSSDIDSVYYYTQLQHSVQNGRQDGRQNIFMIIKYNYVTIHLNLMNLVNIIRFQRANNTLISHLYHQTKYKLIMLHRNSTRRPKWPSTQYEGPQVHNLLLKRYGCYVKRHSHSQYILSTGYGTKVFI